MKKRYLDIKYKVISQVKAKAMLEFIADLAFEPERMIDPDLREKTIFEAKEIIQS